MCDITNDSLAHDSGLHCATVVENKQKQICGCSARMGPPILWLLQEVHCIVKASAQWLYKHSQFKQRHVLKKFHHI